MFAIHNWLLLFISSIVVSDKFGTKIGYGCAMALWSIACIGHAFARSIFGFGIARSILGFGESANFPAAIKSVAEWFPKKERALATSIFNSGANVGVLIALVTVPFITIQFGWKWAFISTGFLGFILLLFFWIPIYKLPKDQKKLLKAEYDFIHSDSVEEKVEQIPWKKLFTYKQTFAICLAKLATDWVWWFYLYWAPDFLNKKFGVNIVEVILPLLTIYTVSSFGGVAGGWLSSNYIKKGRGLDFSRKTTILICAIFVIPVIFVPQSTTLWVAVALLSIGTAAHQGMSTNLFTIISDIFPKNMVGSMVGLAGFVGAMGGAVSAFLIGLILQATNSYFLIFAIAGSTYFITWLVLKVLIPKIEPLPV